MRGAGEGGSPSPYLSSLTRPSPPCGGRGIEAPLTQTLSPLRGRGKEGAPSPYLSPSGGEG